MIDWKDVNVEAAAKDRLILVTSGWAWRREDTHTPGKFIERTRVTLPARHYKHRRVMGAVLMVYWIEDAARKEGGLWAVAGKDSAFFEPFLFWADVNNPLTAKAAAQSDPLMLVQNIIPKVDDMPVYVPSKKELQVRHLENILRSGD